MNDALNLWITLVSSQDMEGVVNLYAEDGLLLGTFSDEIRVGKGKIKEYFQFFLSKNPIASVIDSKLHIIDDNSFTVNGFYDFEVDASNGQREIAHARFTFVFRKDTESFKILSHHSSVMP
tara:strand:- start:47 stop:409 length:363 start_codon:yes stop_codon:yes gene_type:complete